MLAQQPAGSGGPVRRGSKPGNPGPASGVSALNNPGTPPPAVRELR
jgi:hypothetical protein